MGAARGDDGREAEIAALDDELVQCRRCPRLVAWREEIVERKRAAFRDREYWGRPVPGFGDPHARLLVLGLAPAAHGANRTGRMFTGDRAGDWLYASMHRCGWANQPTSTGRDDGLRLDGAYVTASVRCAPPQNKPTPSERDNCAPWLRREAAILADVSVVIALGHFAWNAALAHFGPVRPKPRFGHGAESPAGAVTLLGSYHPSQQNTFTGRLTEPMLDAVFTRARELLT